MNKVFAKWGLALAVTAVAGISTVKAEGDGGPLIDALVKKGVLTSQEGEEIRGEMQSDYMATPGGMLQLGSSADKSLKLYGDARFRYQYDRTEKNATPQDVRERNRQRYRLRVGAEYQFADNFVGGFRLATGNDRNSTNVDFGTGNKTFTANDNIRVDLVYLTWKEAFGQDWISMTGGRQLLDQNIITGWTWDSDINPDGGLLKLGSWSPVDNFTIGGTSGAYVWLDTTDNNFGGAQGNEDVWMFVNQVDFGYTFSKDWALRVSPGFISTIGSDDGTAGTGGWAATQADTSDLNVFFVDAALNTPFFLEGTKGKLYGEYGLNVSAKDMSESFNGPGVAADIGGQFFVAGYQVSAGKGKGSWAFDATYVYYEAYSWSPVLIDSDTMGLNAHGFGLKASYGFTDNITGSINWRKEWHIDDTLTAADATYIGGDNASFDIVQVDLSWKF